MSKTKLNILIFFKLAQSAKKTNTKFKPKKQPCLQGLVHPDVSVEVVGVVVHLPTNLQGCQQLKLKEKNH